jgi:hypothetical protein
MKRCENEKGSILLLSIFAIFVLAAFLALIVNGSFLIIEKIVMQNAVDASAYSGAVVQARGLNLLSLLNRFLVETRATYESDLLAWRAAWVADEFEPEGPAQRIWRAERQAYLSRICAPSRLDKIRCVQSRIVARFNGKSSDTGCASDGASIRYGNIVAAESETLGKKNTGTLELEEIRSSGFSSWAVNNLQGSKFPGLSVERDEETSVYLTGAGANGVSKGIGCDIPSLWILKPDFKMTQYVLSASTTVLYKGMLLGGYFGSGDRIYAISRGEPYRPDMESLTLLSSDWEAKLVPVSDGENREAGFQAFRLSPEGKRLGFQQVPTRPLIH